MVANVLANAVQDPAEIRKGLVEQVTGTVRWRESISWLADQGVDTFVEVGTGKVLTGMVKRISREATGVAVNTPTDIDALLERINS